MQRPGGQKQGTKMKACRSRLQTMRLVLLLCQLGLILRTKAQVPNECIVSVTNRPPENNDITVNCGAAHMDLSIFLCPVYQARYNESLMVLNDEYSKPDCFGVADWTVDPPLLRFRLPMNDSSIAACSNSFRIINQMGTGTFAQFSNIQFVNISGTVTSVDPTAGMITYRPQIMYKFSCLYPMQYLLNNTQVGVSGVNLAITDNNGTFISTLSMLLYSDEDYRDILLVPQTGINLKTKIYVSVKATNLTDRFNVLLDRCYASTSQNPMSATFYDLFVGCNRDAQTIVDLNGVSQKALFSFEAFRFMEHRNQTVSTFYLHCVTRLCEVSSCSALLPVCGTSVRKREAPDVSANTTITSPAIFVGRQSSGDAQTFSASNGMSAENQYSSPVVAVIVCIVILTILLVAMSIYFALYIRKKKTESQ